MKTVTTILILISLSASAQKIKIKQRELWLVSDSSQTVTEGFKFISKATSFHVKLYRRYVVKDGVTYFKPFLRRYYPLVELKRVNKI